MECRDEHNNAGVTEETNFQQVHEKYKPVARDYFHAFLFALITFFTLRASFIDAGLSTGHFWCDILNSVMSASISDFFTFIGAVAFILFGIVGIYEFAYLNGLHMLVPPYYIYLKEQKDEKVAEIMMKVYYKKDMEFIQQYEKDRVNSILEALKINSSQFRYLSYEIVKARSMAGNNRHQLQSKASKIILEERFIKNLTTMDECDRVYKNVNYFINLYTALYDSKIRSDVSRIMANYITMCINPNSFSEIDYIVIPSGSNLLMGLEVAEILGKPTIAILEEARINRREPWDGEYKWDANRLNHIIIIHDVLVTGDKICNVTKKLPINTYQIDGLYCLAKYVHKNYTPEAKIMNACNISYNKIHCLLHITEEQLADKVKRK